MRKGMIRVKANMLKVSIYPMSRHLFKKGDQFHAVEYSHQPGVWFTDPDVMVKVYLAK